MSKFQASKRARKIRKQARFAGLWGWWAHPSHKAGRRWKRLRYELHYLEVDSAAELGNTLIAFDRTDSVGSLGIGNCTITGVLF